MTSYEEPSRQRMDYVHLNPLRKELVMEPERWFYSSAWLYIEERPEPLETDVLE